MLENGQSTFLQVSICHRVTEMLYFGHAQRKHLQEESTLHFEVPRIDLTTQEKTQTTLNTNNIELRKKNPTREKSRKCCGV